MEGRPNRRGLIVCLSAAGVMIAVALAAAARAAGERPEETDVKQPPSLMDRVAVKHGAWVIPDDADLTNPQWRAAMDAHRARQRKRIPPVDRPEEITRSFVEGFAFIYDRRLYDARKRRWLIDEFLDRGEEEFGGYDQVILWQSYPRLGIDDRNQFDHYRDMPGGMAAVGEWVRTCHRRGVRLLLTYNPWDRHTRDGDRHLPDMLEALKVTGADGVYLDTLGQVPPGWAAAMKKLGRGIYFESEGHPWNKRIAAMHSAWGQGWQIHPPCQVFNTRWLWPAHKTFLTHDRHSRDHWDELCSAWFTGTGVLVWEVVFGNDTSWVERDKAMLRRLKPLLVALTENFAHPDWQPIIAGGHEDLKVHRFGGPLGTVYTLCWTKPAAYRGPLLPAEATKTYVDLFTGETLAVSGGNVIGEVPGRSVGGVLEADKLTPSLKALLKKVCPGGRPRFTKARTERLRAVGKAERSPAGRSRYNGTKPRQLPPGMVWVPSGRFVMKIDHRWHGATCYDHYEWGKRGKAIDVRGFAIDRFPVTNAQFAEFLTSSGYAPADKTNLLKHWVEGRIPKGLQQHPVVYVSLADARAYAKWARKRLPTEAQWQYAAQGPDGLAWPWGKRLAQTRVNAAGRTAPVGSFPADASAFGVRDLCGHVWQWVDEVYTDRVHSFTVLKGGSFYRLPDDASKWYIHTGPLRPTSHIKVPLLAPSLDRFATVGFRCVID